MAKAPGGTSSVITDPAATHALSPIVTGARNALSTPVLTLRPIVVRCLPWPSSWGKLAVMFPAATVVSKVTPILGGVDDKTRPPQGASRHRLVLRGFVVMAGVEIKS